LPFGFAAGDDPDRERGGAGRGSSGSGSSGADPFGFGSGGFNPADLGQIFTQLGQMFSGAAADAASGQPAGPVNYDIARQLASSSIGFVAPITASTTS
ncbi:zinc-dependent metalloprotease, partial [Mycobacteroides abscessus subsp. massiliense]